MLRCSLKKTKKRNGQVYIIERKDPEIALWVERWRRASIKILSEFNAARIHRLSQRLPAYFSDLGWSLVRWETQHIGIHLQKIQRLTQSWAYASMRSIGHLYSLWSTDMWNEPVSIMSGTNTNFRRSTKRTLTSYQFRRYDLKTCHKGELYIFFFASKISPKRYRLFDSFGMLLPERNPDQWLTPLHALADAEQHNAIFQWKQTSNTKNEPDVFQWNDWSSQLPQPAETSSTKFIKIFRMRTYRSVWSPAQSMNMMKLILAIVCSSETCRLRWLELDCEFSSNRCNCQPFSLINDGLCSLQLIGMSSLDRSNSEFWRASWVCIGLWINKHAILSLKWQNFFLQWLDSGRKAGTGPGLNQVCDERFSSNGAICKLKRIEWIKFSESVSINRIMSAEQSWRSGLCRMHCFLPIRPADNITRTCISLPWEDPMLWHNIFAERISLSMQSEILSSFVRIDQRLARNSWLSIQEIWAVFHQCLSLSKTSGVICEQQDPRDLHQLFQRER